MYNIYKWQIPHNSNILLDEIWNGVQPNYIQITVHDYTNNEKGKFYHLPIFSIYPVNFAIVTILKCNLQ